MTARQRQIGVIVSTVLVALLLALPTLAAKGNKTHNGRGKVTAVGNNSITVQKKKGEPKTFTTSAATTVTLDDKAATLADLQVGQHAKIKSADGTSATAITAHSKGKKGKKAQAVATVPF